jgi:hypothetical protein
LASNVAPDEFPAHVYQSIENLSSHSILTEPECFGSESKELVKSKFRSIIFSIREREVHLRLMRQKGYNNIGLSAYLTLVLKFSLRLLQSD